MRGLMLVALAVVGACEVEEVPTSEPGAHEVVGMIEDCGPCDRWKQLYSVDGSWVVARRIRQDDGSCVFVDDWQPVGTYARCADDGLPLDTGL